MRDVYESIKRLPTIFIIEILPPRLFHIRMSNAASQKRSTKGPLFRKDDCTLPVYLYLLVYDTPV